LRERGRPGAGRHDQGGRPGGRRHRRAGDGQVGRTLRGLGPTTVSWTWSWPVTLRTTLPDGAALVLRPLARSDRGAWEEVRTRNARWLAPWESTAPGRPPVHPPFHRLRRSLDRAARDGLLLPFVIEADGRLVGQVQLFDVLGGARASGLVGYWLDERAT